MLWLKESLHEMQNWLGTIWHLLYSTNLVPINIARHCYTLKSLNKRPLSTNIPLPSNFTPSSFSNFSLLSTFCPLGTVCQSPLKPPMYYVNQLALETVMERWTSLRRHLQCIDDMVPLVRKDYFSTHRPLREVMNSELWQVR